METIWNKIEAVDLIKLHENAQQEKIDMVIYATSDAKDSLQIINGKRVYSNKAKIMAEFEKIAQEDSIWSYLAKHYIKLDK